MDHLGLVESVLACGMELEQVHAQSALLMTGLAGPSFLNAGNCISSSENSIHFFTHLSTSVSVYQSKFMCFNPKYATL